MSIFPTKTSKMSSLQWLDKTDKFSISHKSSFIEFYQGLPTKTSTCIRIFQHSNFYSLHGPDAISVAEQILKNFDDVKMLQKGDADIETLYMKKEQMEVVIRKLLFVFHYKIEVFSVEDGKWQMSARASPGNITEIEDSLLSESETSSGSLSNAVVSIKLSLKDGQNTMEMGMIDYTTSQIFYSTFEDSPNFTNLESIFVQFSPKECLYCKSSDSISNEKLLKVLKRNNICASEVSGKFYNTKHVEQLVNSLLVKRMRNKLKGAVVTTSNIGSMSCLNALITNLKIADREENLDRFQLKEYKLSNYMRLDRYATSALNLFSDKQTASKSSFNSLYALLNNCSTVQGEKKLERWIKQPLIDLEQIKERQQIVDAFIQVGQVREFLSTNILKKVPDLERLAKKVHKRTATLKDCYQIYQTIGFVPAIYESFEKNIDSFDEEKWQIIVENFKVPLQEVNKDFSKYQSMMETTLNFEAIQKHEYLVRCDFDPELQEIDTRIREIETEMDELVASVAETFRLDPKSVKLDQTPQNGYAYRISCKEAKILHKHSRFTTLDIVKNYQRFQDNDLRDLSEELLSLKNAYKTQQEAIVVEIVNVVSGYYQPLTYLNQLLSKLDVLVSFAKMAVTSPMTYVMPKLHAMSSKRDVRIKLSQSRHPCVERQDNVSFIPNDVQLRTSDHNFIIVTGPNMGGKSTFIRQVGVIVIMAQIGSFVPCEEADITIVDAILARMGAGDSQLKGISTFLSEMMETSTILESATENSLVIIDELGRGTSTFDGFGLAWSISHHISTTIKSPCMFATHYHEMTYLADEVKSVVNYHMKAYTDEESGDVVMLHQIDVGACDQSFGINVAQSVGFPDHVIQAAKDKASMLEDFQSYQGSNSIKSEGERLIDDFLRDVTSIGWSSMGEDARKEKLKSLQTKVKNCGNQYLGDVTKMILS